MQDNLIIFASDGPGFITSGLKSMKSKFQSAEFWFVTCDLASDTSSGCLPVSPSLAIFIYLMDFEMSSYFSGCCNLL